jgi:hypothetical protein
MSDDREYRHLSASGFSRPALIGISIVAVLLVAIGSAGATVTASIGCVHDSGSSCRGSIDHMEFWLMMIGPPVLAVGFGVMGVHRGRFTPIVAGALLLFTVGVASPLIVARG